MRISRHPEPNLRGERGLVRRQGVIQIHTLPRPLVRHLVALLVGASLLSACTSTEASPSPIPSAQTAAPTIATTPAPPPTTQAAVYKPATADGPAQNVPVPVLPEKAKEFSKEGLLAFTEYWYETLGYAFETGDPEPMMSISGPDCSSCLAMKETILPWHSDDRWIVGGQMKVLSTQTSFAPAQDRSYQVTALVRQMRLLFYRADKSLAEDRGQKSSVADLVVASHSNGQWRVMDVNRIEGSPK